MNLTNKTVIITGGTKGLGKALALSFKEKGVNVVICAKDKNGFKNLPEGILGIKADVTKEKDLQNLLNKTLRKFRQLDVWINNAGIWLPHLSMEKTDWKRAHKIMEVNFFGIVYGSKIALTQMRKQNYGIIINILSIRSLDPRAGESAYTASKFAAKGFTDSIRKEINNENIKLLSVYPGKIQTNLFNEAKPQNYEQFMTPKSVAEKIIENLIKKTPEKHLVIKPLS